MQQPPQKGLPINDSQSGASMPQFNEKEPLIGEQSQMPQSHPTSATTQDHYSSNNPSQSNSSINSHRNITSRRRIDSAVHFSENLETTSFANSIVIDETGQCVCPHCGNPQPPARLGHDIDLVSIKDDSGEGIPLLEPGGVAASTMSLACVCLGAGIFVLPSVFRDLGLVLGCFAVFIFGLLSDLALLMVYDLAERHHVASFEELMSMGYGTVGRTSVSFFTALTCLIGNSAHLQFCAKIIKDLFEWFCTGKYGKWPFTTATRAIIILSFGLLVMPFCFARTLNALRYMSTATVVYVTILCVICTVFAFVHIGEHGAQNTQRLGDFTPTVLLDSCPVIAFAYAGVLSFFHVYREAKDKATIPKCVHISTSLCCVFYMLVALVGALAFEFPDPDYLYSFPARNVTITIACLGVVIVLVLLYPVLNYVLVCSTDAMLFPNKPSSYKRRRIYSVVFLGCVVVLDSVVPGIAMVFGLAGALGLGMISYALPCAAYLKLCRLPSMENGEHKAGKPNYLLVPIAILTVLLGLTMAIGSTIRIIYKAAIGETS